ncbi:MAG TPA: 3-phosphoshikimate 1-carboxyvinyltransferase [Candidatus Polarisedimenticolaceae bacterium]|nr:3-phosphoshikimate 1-carboxyvinyltransferase [Candidatus Polarisedimenticolaceae bacterium]
MARFVPVLRAPASKSATHRALVLAALASGRSHLRGPLVAEDTEATRRGLGALGVEVERSEDGWLVQGTGGRFEGGVFLDAVGSGTTLRFLTALAALGRRPSRLGGVPRLAERPIEPLLQALRALGGHAARLPASGGEPFLEVGGRPLAGGQVVVDASASSQFASALLAIAPRLDGGLEITLRGNAVSLPYLALTAQMLGRFGAPVQEEPPRFRVPATSLRAVDLEIEGDWSSGAYLLTAAILGGGAVTVERLRSDSRQADTAIVSLLRQCGGHVRVEDHGTTAQGTGSISGFEVDLRQAPDLAPTAAVLALCSVEGSLLRGVAQLRGKESDRLETIAEALTLLGRSVHLAPDLLIVEPSTEPLRPGRIRTHGDHRIAMAFALLTLRVPGVEVDDPACVTKSYPDFWRDLAAIRTGTRAPPTTRRDRCPWWCRSRWSRTGLPRWWRGC